MKFISLTLLFVLALAGRNLVYSQGMIIAPTVESSFAGIQGGGLVGFTTKKDWINAAFYLTSLHKPVSDKASKVGLYGVMSSLPLVRSSKIVFAVNVRAGVSNSRFLVVMPGVDTRVSIRKKMILIVGSSWRYGHPSINGALSFKL